MFGNKKKETVTKKNGIIPTTATHSLNSLVHGTIVEGTVKSESDIRIDGVIKGSLHCNAKVIIGPTGFVEGDVRCVNAVIEGRFEGELSVKEMLEVRENAKIAGSISTNKLNVKPGAVFNVTCKMGNQKSSSSNGTVDANARKVNKTIVNKSTEKASTVKAPKEATKVN